LIYKFYTVGVKFGHIITLPSDIFYKEAPKRCPASIHIPVIRINKIIKRTGQSEDPYKVLIKVLAIQAIKNRQ
jgi:hypothetical protein